MKKLLFVCFSIALGCIIPACFKDKVFPAGSRGRCESCHTDTDCETGLKCRGFYNQSGVYNRCATAQTTSCPQ